MTDPFADLPRRVSICEVGARDGLQNEPVPISTEDKVRYCDLLSEAGFPLLEATSFVSPKAVPQMADGDEVFRRIAKRPGTTYLALVPNERGLERALAAGVRAIAIFTAASEAFAQANIRTSIDASLTTFAGLVKRAKAEGIFVRGSVSTAFGCPFEGDVPVAAVVRICERMLELGVDELSVADTIGVGTPNQVVELVGALRAAVPLDKLALHFHDTRGTAMANTAAALAMGVHMYDSSAGGLGGCPFAPGATGNAATEDLLYLLHGMGIETGIDLDKVRAASRFIAAQAGPPAALARVHRAGSGGRAGVNAERFPGVVAARRASRVLADNGGGSQVPRECLEAVARFLEHDNAQKGAPFARRVRTSETIAAARDSFADFIGVPRGTIGLGLNATSIAFALARALAHTIRPGDRIVVTDSDHYANVIPWAWLRRFGAELDPIPVDARGELDEAAYAAALAREPVLVALPWASNGTGNVFDVARLAAAAKAAGALVMIDGVQAGPHLRVDVPASADAVFFSAYKMFAPHFGAWYAHPDFARRFFTADGPALPSAPIHWSMETGTQNHEGLAGWLGTIAYLRSVGEGDARAAMDRIAAYERELSRYATARFAERADRIALYGRPAGEERLPLFAFNAARRVAGGAGPRARRREHRSRGGRLLRPAPAPDARPRNERQRRPPLLRPLQRHHRHRPLLRGDRCGCRSARIAAVADAT